MKEKFSALIKTVQHNCHIADARHAGDYTLCVYLLKMREMYRWEQQIGFKKQLTTDDVGDWLTGREGLWDDLEDQQYNPLKINNKQHDAFDNDVINTLLDDHKLVYNAGLGLRCRPHFFIADLEERVEHDDYTIYVSGKEYARDMAAPAAMAQGNRIFVRKESLRRVIWEMLDDAMIAGLDNPLTRAMGFYEFDTDIEKALDDMTQAEITYVIEHEIGEVKAGNLLANILDNDWNDMIAKFNKTHAEIMLRAIRDHLADTLTTLPKLLKSIEGNKDKASLHFYFGNMTAMRKHLAPGLIDAYQYWYKTGLEQGENDSSRLQEIVDKSENHWLGLMSEVNALYQQSQQAEPIESLIKKNILT